MTREVEARRNATFARYVALHRAFFSAGSGPVAVPGAPGAGERRLRRRYILVRPCCQLCNRLRVLISALALGILTDRAVVIEFDKEYYGRLDDLFESPLALQARPA